ncbi:DNA-binding helix-turn-helix protein [Leptotrichia sp. oral taxon 215 str. W9775]|nr:DNA-binding helix-turn-helix protein [Leptotrichia sp. oral taxon 215 str. W9775]
MGYNISIKSRKENLNMGNKVDCHIRIKEAMELRNLNQSDIVERTNIKKSALSQYISGKITPRQNAIDELSKVLNVSEPWLMGYDVPMKRTVLKKETQKSKTDDVVLTPEQEAELQYIIEHNMLFFKRNKMDEDDAKKLADILREFYIETLEQK